MKKAIFANKLFFIFIVSLIIILLAYNFFVTARSMNIYGIIPIFFEIVLLVLIITKNQYVKLAIIIWASISFIVGCGFEFVADLMDLINDDFKKLKIESTIQSAIGLALGILIITYTRRTVVLKSKSDEFG